MTASPSLVAPSEGHWSVPTELERNHAPCHCRGRHVHLRAGHAAPCAGSRPRAYSNSPVGLNFVLAGYGYASGTVLTDPSLPLETSATKRMSASSVSPRPSARLAKPGSLASSCPTHQSPRKGLVLGSATCPVHVDGFADTAFRLSMNFVGAPALTAAESRTTVRI